MWEEKIWEIMATFSGNSLLLAEFGSSDNNFKNIRGAQSRSAFIYSTIQENYTEILPNSTMDLCQITISSQKSNLPLIRAMTGKENKFREKRKTIVETL